MSESGSLWKRCGRCFMAAVLGGSILIALGWSKSASADDPAQPAPASESAAVTPDPCTKVAPGETVTPAEQPLDLRFIPTVPEKQERWDSRDWEEKCQEPKPHKKGTSKYQPPESQPVGPMAPMPSPLLTFAGLGFNDACTGGQCGGGWPPDTVGDVGPNHYIQAVNTAFGVYNKSGTLLASSTFNNLWSGAGTGTPCDNKNYGDPVVIYDPMGDRWFVTDFAFNLSGGNPVAPCYECIAVSKTSDPVSGGWYLYAINQSTVPGGSGLMNDYPKFGIWTDGLYQSANMFTLPAGSYWGAAFWAYNRLDMEAGKPITPVTASISGTSTFTMLPANLRIGPQGAWPAAGTPAYLIQDSQTAYQFEVRKFTVNWGAGTGTLSAATNVAYTTVGNPRSPSQPGTAQTLDSLAWRAMMQAQYKKVGGTESLWVNHTVRSSAGTGANGIQWSQVNVNGGTISTTPVQTQLYRPDTTLDRWMGSLAVDGQGNMALGYSTSNNTAPNYPSLKYAGRLAGDALNSLPQTETTLFAGTGSQTTYNRWGDYSAMSVDPTDDCTFWYTNEYYAATGTNWRTRVGAFKFPSCTITSGTLVATVKDCSGTVIKNAVVTIDGHDYGVTPAAGTFTAYLTPGSHTIYASYLGSSSSTQTVTVPGTVTLNVGTAPSVTTSPASTSVCSGGSTTLTVAASGTSLHYQWYEGTAPSTTTPVGTDANSFTTPNLTSTTSYWVRVSNGCGTADSATATVTVTSGTSISAGSPADPTAICTGNTASLTVSASGSNLHYQWYQGTASDTTTPVGTDSNSYTTATLTGNTNYWVRVTGDCGTADSRTATVAVNAATSIAAGSPADPAAVCSGNTANLTVSAAGINLHYQWYQGTAPSTATPVGTDSNSYTTAALASNTNYWVRVTGDCGTADSRTATVSVKTPPSVTANPTNQTVCATSSVSFFASASGSPSGPVHAKSPAIPPLGPPVQWQVSTNGGVSFSDISGATSTTLTFTTAAGDNGNQYRAVFTNSCGTATTTAATLTVNTATSITTGSPADPAAICSGSTATLTVSATGSNLHYQWYQGTAPSTTTPVGTDSNSFTTPALTGTTGYWVRVTGDCGTADSRTAAVTVNTGTSITAGSPADPAPICSGNTATLTVSASGTSLHYQWYQGSAPSTVTPVGTDSNSFTTPALAGTTNYWVRVTGTCGTADSRTASVTVNATTTITAGSPADPAAICSGNTATLTVSASGTALHYQWYQGTAPSTTTPVGTDANSFTTPSLTGNTNYWVRVTGTCGTADSRTATVTVGSGPAITLNPSSVAVLAPTGTSFSAAASGNPAPTVQWQVSTNGGGSFSDLGGQTSTTLTIASTTVAMNGYQYRAVFTNGCGTATTSAATLTVWAPVVATASTPSPTTGVTPLTVSFLGAASGGDGGPYTYSWTFGDGSPASSAQNPAHTYNIGGAFTVILTVQDGHGNSASDNHLVINVTQSSVPVVYNLYDDQGRARACVNRYTGEYRWMAPAAAPTVTASGVAQVLNGGVKYVSKAGDPNILNVTVDALKKKANGYCVIGGVYYYLTDSDITNNPPGCY
jgi:hypothetical protein